MIEVNIIDEGDDPHGIHMVALLLLCCDNGELSERPRYQGESEEPCRRPSGVEFDYYIEDRYES
jgi:hypothetical protein